MRESSRVLTLGLALIAGFAAIAAAPGLSPIIEPGVAEAVEGGRTAKVNIVLRGNRSLPLNPSSADEKAVLDEVAAAHRNFHAAIPEHGIHISREHTYVAGLAAEIDLDGLEALQRMPQVERVYLDGTVRATDTEGNALIGANILQGSGYTGAGLAIAIVDTGVDYTHAALGGCLGNIPACRVKGGFDFVNNDSNPADDNGHGTEVAGTAAGNGGSITGVAPGANLVALKVLAANGSGSFSAIDSALNWVLTNRVTFNIKVVNMSLGDGSQHNSSSGTPCGSSSTATLIQSLVNAGVAVAVASGNDAFTAGVSFPACVAQATAVGGVYDANVGGISWCGATCSTILCTDNPTFADKWVCHTNAGVPLDVLAPDYKTTTSRLGGGTADFGGTSAASPFVAGAFALMFNVAPTASVATIESNLKSTGVSILDPFNGASYPRIQVNLAAQNFDADLDGHPDSADNCPTVYNPNQADGDGDGKGNVCDNCPTISNASQANLDGDPAGDACDCDPARASVYPGAPEVCDGFNNNCNSPVWPSLSVETDDDHDGFAECAGDCNDADTSMGPGFAELCDGKDNNCDGSVPANEADADADGYRICQGDCNDANAAQHPGLPELCNGIDDNCDSIVPANEADADADGFRICQGDCDDTHATVHPGATEVCDGLDNDCVGGVPANEANADADGFRICQGDCDDAHANVYPGAPEVCDGFNNNCLNPVWPSLSVETDDDGDGLAECAGDCNDANARMRPGLADGCDGLDNDCNGSVDPGYGFLTQTPLLTSVTDPNASASDQVGAGLLPLSDLTGDGIPDFAVAAPGWPVGLGNMGSVLIYSGATRTVVRRLTDPVGDNIAHLGTTLATPGDVNGDGQPDIAAGSPFQAVGGTSGRGRVNLFSGATGTVLWSYQDFELPQGAHVGAGLAAIADLDGDGVREIVVGIPFDCSGGLGCSGGVSILSGANGIRFRFISDAVDETGEMFGSAVTGLGDLDGDGKEDVAVGAPFRDVSGVFDAGAVLFFSGANGALIRTIGNPAPGVDDEFGSVLAPAGDLDGDGKIDLLVGVPKKDTAAGADAGSVIVLSGRTGAILFTITDPNGAAGDAFGSSVSAAGDIDLDLLPDIIVGSPLDDTAAGADAGSAVLFSGRTGQFLARFTHAAGAAGDRFGGAVGATPPLDGDGIPEILCGVPLDDTAAGADAGSVQLFTPHTVGDCDSDGVPNTSDTCTDTDGDGYCSTAFFPPAGPSDCDDDHSFVRPGFPQVCDGYNNNCSDPGWPAVPAAECFATDNLVITYPGGQVHLSWNVPSGGADSYRIYRGTTADLLAGHNGGICFNTTTATVLQFTDSVPLGTMAFYLVAGVRGGVEGSRGVDDNGVEREHSNVCP